MIFKVPALREEVGDPLDMYSVNRDSSPTSLGVPYGLKNMVCFFFPIPFSPYSSSPSPH